ncbi:MAG TPA: glycosyltransferase [Arcobacter sp.]|nr:glycosyltransferase [Arcobacter sp.]
MKKIVYFPSENENSNHTSVEALFNKYLKKFFLIQIVYSGEKTKKLSDGNLVIKKSKRYNFINELKDLAFDSPNFYIVRNDFNVLKNIINNNKNSQIGFQSTFLHSYRRLVQAHIEKKKLLRKYIEYMFKSKEETKLIEKCDFLIPNSKMMNKVINQSNKPYTYIYSSFDFELSSDVLNKKSDDNKVRFLYIGTVDKLREIDKIFEAFSNVKSQNWILDVYTKNFDEATTYKSKMKKNENLVNIYNSLDRKTLYKTMAGYDVGISLIPINDLYTVASPIKLSEYFACKLAVITTAIPEAVDLYADTNSAFFVHFDTVSISKTINNILQMDKEELNRMGLNGFNIVKQKRNYKTNAKYIVSFLNSLKKNK